MTQYHYIHSGIPYGPVSSLRLVQLVNQGILAPTDRCWAEGMTGWTSISQLPRDPRATAPVRPPAVVRTPAPYPGVSVQRPRPLELSPVQEPLLLAPHGDRRPAVSSAGALPAPSPSPPRVHVPASAPVPASTSAPAPAPARHPTSLVQARSEPRGASGRTGGSRWIIRRVAARLCDIAISGVLPGGVLATLALYGFIPGLVAAETAIVGTLASWLVLYVLYDTLFLHRSGTTPGKRLLGLRLSGRRALQESFSLCLLRTLTWLGGGLLAGLGWFRCLIDPRGIGFHDRVSGTRVLADVAPSRDQPRSGGASAVRRAPRPQALPGMVTGTLAGRPV